MGGEPLIKIFLGSFLLTTFSSGLLNVHDTKFIHCLLSYFQFKPEPSFFQ